MSEILRNVKWRRCFLAKMKAEEDFGFIARLVMSTDFYHLDAIQDYALVVVRDIQINGLL